MSSDTLPYAVRRTRVIWMIVNAPPPKPLCFETDGQWQEYLMYLHESGERITRIVDRGAARGNGTGGSPRVVTREFDRIDYCADCDVGGKHQRRMQVEGRCIMPLVPPSPTTDSQPGALR